MHAFFDAFVLGEGEEVIDEIAASMVGWKAADAIGALGIAGGGVREA